VAFRQLPPTPSIEAHAPRRCRYCSAANACESGRTQANNLLNQQSAATAAAPGSARLAQATFGLCPVGPVSSTQRRDGLGTEPRRGGGPAACGPRTPGAAAGECHPGRSPSASSSLCLVLVLRSVPEGANGQIWPPPGRQGGCRLARGLDPAPQRGPGAVRRVSPGGRGPYPTRPACAGGMKLARLVCPTPETGPLSPKAQGAHGAVSRRPGFSRAAHRPSLA